MQVKNLTYLYFKNGEEALELENLIKKNFKTSVISKEILPVGFTETLQLADINLLLNILMNFKNKET